MTMRVFENWSPESVPCPRCRTLLPSADATCPRCGHEATSTPPTQPIPTHHAATTEPTYPGLPSWPTAPQPGPVPPPFYPVVRPARRGPRVGRIVLVILVVAVLGAGAYGLHRVTQHAEKQLADQSVPTAIGPTLEPLTTTSLSAIPVQVGELPYGWTAVPADPGTSSPATDSQMTACVGQESPNDPGFGPKPESDFAQGQFKVESDAQRITSVAGLRAQIAVLRNPKVPACLAKGMRQTFTAKAAGAKLLRFRMHVRAGPHDGPANVLATITMQMIISANDRIVVAHFDSVLIASKKVAASISFFSYGAPFDAALRAKLTGAVSGRVAQYKP